MTFYCPSSIFLSADNQWQWCDKPAGGDIGLESLGSYCLLSLLGRTFSQNFKNDSVVSSFCQLPIFVLEWFISLFWKSIWR